MINPLAMAVAINYPNIIRVFATLCFYVVASYGFVAWKYRVFLKIAHTFRPLLVSAHVFVVISNIVAFFVFVMVDRHASILPPLSWAGLAIAIAGAAFLAWGIATLKIATFSSPTNGELVATGPYSITGHPMYVGGVIGGFGLATWSASMLGLIYALVIALTLIIISREEEKDLIERFGSAYSEYKKKTLMGRMYSRLIRE
ncbi:MAG TPA: isoprenylcysteine carboxylmethyltransferase family protein [Anaerolineae bacterium]|jgi:protein-S-isoprenylcysteine O-methyltransferase Ste14|nr:isoprenylcysteine carboxylmethyltransferase family protein [Anaerolineae bacterium]